MDWSDAAVLCVIDVAFKNIRMLFVWQVGYLEISNCYLYNRCDTGKIGHGLVAHLDRIGRVVTPR